MGASRLEGERGELGLENALEVDVAAEREDDRLAASERPALGD